MPLDFATVHKPFLSGTFFFFDKYINQDLGQALGQRYCHYILISSVQVSSDSYIAIAWWDPQEKNNYFQNALKHNQ